MQPGIGYYLAKDLGWVGGRKLGSVTGLVEPATSDPHVRPGSTDEAALAVPLMGPQQVLVHSYLGVENSGLSQGWLNQQLLEPAKQKES